MRGWNFRAFVRSVRAVRAVQSGASGASGASAALGALRGPGVAAASLALVLGLSPVLGGCASVYSTVTVAAAESRVEQARVLGAETAAPFEYYYAAEHLRQARIEAAEASYGDAAEYADTAERYAQKAIDTITAARKSAK